MITDDDILNYLEHHGVKGMRWGHRKKHDSLERQPRVSKRQARKDRKASEKQARIAEGQKKANALLKHALKNKDDLFLVNGHTVVTGKEFVDHLALGGLLNVKTSGLYATKTKSGYVRTY